VIYSETSLHLRPADTLTFVADGVVAARNAEGTLFGFDRTQSIISHQAHWGNTYRVENRSNEYNDAPQILGTVHHGFRGRVHSSLCSR
jgi:hypothetical protein